MKILLDFVCEEGHVHEAFVDSSTKEKSCNVCGKPAVKKLSTPQVRLEGTTGSFPGAAMRWEKVRQEKLQQERKQAASQ